MISIIGSTILALLLFLYCAKCLSLAIKSIVSPKNLGLKRFLSSLMVGASIAQENPFSSLLAPSIANAAPITTNKYYNARYQTEIKYPSDWVASNGVISGERSVDAFVDPSDPDSSLSLVFTPIPADYTRLNSFGGKETIKQYLIPKGPDIETNVISEAVAGDVYLVEYTIKAGGLPERHVQNIFALKSQDAIIGVTLQTKEANFDKYKDIFTEIIPSFHYEN